MNTPSRPRSSGVARPDDAARPAADNTLPPDEPAQRRGNAGNDGRSDVAGSGNTLGDGRTAGGDDSAVRRERDGR